LSQLFNIPNLISAFRIILIPVFLYLIFLPDAEMRVWALIVFCVASLTDLLDGWSARKLGQETDTGKFLDPIADKFLVISALIAFMFLDPLIPFWMILVIVARDMMITFMRYLAMKTDTPLRTTRFGKVKTAFQMISIIVIIMVLIIRTNVVNGYESISSDAFLKVGMVLEVLNSSRSDKWLTIGPYCLMAIVTILTILSGLRYIITNRKLFVPTTYKK